MNGSLAPAQSCEMNMRTYFIFRKMNSGRQGLKYYEINNEPVSVIVDIF